MLAFQTGVLYGNACIAEFAAAVAVKEIETYGDAEVQPEVAAAAVGGNIIFVKGIAVAAIHLYVRVVAGTGFFIVQPCQRIVLFGFQ